MSNSLIAHSANHAGETHDLIEHLKSVALLCALAAPHACLQEKALLVGWLHDVGKMTCAWQAYINGPLTPGTKGPPHASVGALILFEARQWFAATSVECHHTGLKDRADLKARWADVARSQPPSEIKQAAEEILTRGLLQELEVSIPAVPEEAPFDKFWYNTHKEAALWMRMLHSSLVDTDYLDTSAHFQGPRRASPTLNSCHLDAIRRHKATLQERATSPINTIRQTLAQEVVSNAVLPPGWFRLDLPTGMGKTLSGLEFAVTHALEHGLNRVILAHPYLALTEQSAHLYKSILGEDQVLEHHSQSEDLYTQEEEPTDMMLAAQNWDTPFIITTQVQLLETLYASRNSKLRKLHNIASSVIILDELQALPTKLLKPTLQALDLLVRDFGCSIVISTATQPVYPEELVAALDKLPHIRSLSTQSQDLALPPRVALEWDPHPMTWAALAVRVLAHPQALVILNTVKDAQTFQEYVPYARILTSRQCPLHRRRILCQVQEDLAQGIPCILVATQVIETGVDIDFPVVYRALGPLECLAQAAGRCNRESALERPGRFIIFTPSEGGLPNDSTYKLATKITESLLTPCLDITCKNLLTTYYQRLYALRDLDAYKILTLEKDLAWRTVSQTYKLIDEATQTVLVDYHLTEELRALTLQKLTAQDWSRLKPYLVSLPSYLFEAGQTQGLIRIETNDLPIWEGPYQEQGIVITSG